MQPVLRFVCQIRDGNLQADVLVMFFGMVQSDGQRVCDLLRRPALALIPRLSGLLVVPEIPVCLLPVLLAQLLNAFSVHSSSGSISMSLRLAWLTPCS